jgi:hypothetical protein
MLRSAMIIAALVTLVRAGKSSAQTTASPISDSPMRDSLKAALGATVRIYTVSSEPAWIRGTLTSVSSSDVALQDARGTHSISLADIQGAERFMGQPRWKGALAGLAFGIGAGVIIGYAIGANDDRDASGQAALAGTGGFFGGIEGGLIGGILGPIGGALLTPATWQVLVPHR